MLSIAACAMAHNPPEAVMGIFFFAIVFGYLAWLCRKVTK